MAARSPPTYAQPLRMGTLASAASLACFRDSPSAFEAARLPESFPVAVLISTKRDLEIVTDPIAQAQKEVTISGFGD